MNPIDALGGWLTDTLTTVLTVIQSVDPALRTLLAGIGMFLETSFLVGLVVPGDTIVIVASTAVSSLPEYLALVAAVILGALGGESLGFALGRFFGPRIRRSALGRRIGERTWTRAQNYVDRRGGIAVFVSRFLPVLHSLVPLTVGMSAMRYRTFLAWTAPATVIWTLSYVTVGTLAGGTFRELLDRLHYGGYVFVGIIVVFLVGMLIVKRFVARSEDRYLE